MRRPGPAPQRLSVCDAGVRAGLWLMALMWAAAPAWADGPVRSPTGPDAAAYGEAAGYPVPPAGVLDGIAQEFHVGMHSRYDRFRALRPVPTSATASALKRRTPQIELTYEHKGRSSSITEYLSTQPVTGLLIAQDDTILYEHYQYGRSDEDRFLSHSMAKTITGLLVGAALEEGAIRSLDDVASVYVPELAGTEYGATPIIDLLRMMSGMAFSERYTRGDDLDRMVRSLMGPGAPGAVEAIGQIQRRVQPPGTRFSYSSADSELLGLVLSRATQMPLATYFSTRLWGPLGAEANAAWDVDAKGQEMTFCCVVARLRDWARLGLMIAHDGRWNGRQVVSRQWLNEMTTPDRSAYSRYGYQLWLSGGSRRYYVMRGIMGQRVLIDPAARLVLVQTAVHRKATDTAADADLTALWEALRSQQGLAERVGFEPTVR